MRETGFGKRLISMLLALVIIIGLAPDLGDLFTKVFAADETIYVLAGSDFQNTSNDHTAGAEYVTQLLNSIKTNGKYDTMDGFLFAGDYDYGYDDPAAGKAALQGAVQAVYGTDMDEVYVEGNHDSLNFDLVSDGTLSPSGANDADGYGVYVIHESDYMWYNDDEATIKETANRLKTYLDYKVETKYDAPIFVVSHLPLHYNMRTRTDNNGDGKYANYIFDVLNEAGNAGLNIIFLFGHNHSHGWDDYLGGAAIYLKAGDKINIAQGSTTVFKEETLSFTYMNAGYVSYYGTSYTSDVDKTLTMTVFEITNDKVTVKRFDTEGLHNLKSTGFYNVEYPDSAYYSTNSTTYTSPQTITLQKFITGNTYSNNNVTVTAPNLTGLNVTKVFGTANTGSYNTNQYAAYASYDITPVGYTQGNAAEVTITLDEVDGFDASKPVLVIDKAKNQYTTKKIVDGKVTFTTDHFSTYDVAQIKSTEIEVPILSSGTTERTYTRVTSLDKLVDGGQYLIIENGSTDYFMLPESISNDDGTRIGYNVESTSVAGGDTITGDYSTKEWTMTGSGTNWVLSTSSGSAYMEYQSSSRAYGRISSTNSSTFTIGGSADAYTFSTTTNGYTYVFDHSSAGMINGYVKTPSTTFYIYHLTDEGSSTPTVNTSGGNWVTLQEPTQAGYQYELDIDGVDTGVEYLIVAKSSYEKALSAAASSNNAVDITINGNYAYATSDAYGWTFTMYSNGVYYIRLNNSTYLRLNNNALGGSNSSDSSRRWTVSSNGDGTYDIVRNNYNLRWSNSNGVFQVSSSYEGPVRLYKYVKETTAQAGIYGGISGELSYIVDIGTTKEDAVQTVKDGIEVYWSNSNSGAVTGGNSYADDGENMTWTIDESYDGTTPGEYAVTIAYNGITLGVAKVIVPNGTQKLTVTIDSVSGSVNKGVGFKTKTGSVLTITDEDGNVTTVPVTVSMLKNADGTSISTAETGTLTGLKVCYIYNGIYYEVFTDYTLNILGKSGNNYPEYPDEGAVKVSKNANGIDFQSSGIAQVELSASGVPVKKGADVVVVIDTSSSMDEDIDGDTPENGEMSRIDILSESLKNMLSTFQKEADLDIDIAVIDFNGYSNRITGASLNNSYRDENNDNAEVYTGVEVGSDITNYISEVGLSASNFVDVHSLNAETFAALFDEDRTSSGTNYDNGLNNAYKLLQYKQEANANADEDRDQYVIFLSDGAPFRYNGYENGSGGSGYNNWDKWLRGVWANQAALEAAIPNNGTNNCYPYFYNGNGTSHPHRIAEAIKGTPGEPYEVVINTATTANPAYIQEYMGLGAQIFSIGFGLAEDSGSGEAVTVPAMQSVLKAISSGDAFYYDVDTAAELTDAFTLIANAIVYAVSNARFVDQMGGSFNLLLEPKTYDTIKLDENGNTVDTDGDGEADLVTKTVTPTIEIISYDIYTKSEVGKVVNGVTVTESMVGDRKGTYTLQEVVMFSEDGTKAYSSKIDADGDGVYGVKINDDGTYTIQDTGDNILAPQEETETDGWVDGVIYAQTFLYNTNATEVAIDGVDIPTGTNTDGATTSSTNVLPKETFYWKMGTVQTTELTMRYYVYLDGSMEGTKEAGAYATNEFAILYYDNYLENPCYKATVSPVTAWKEAGVSYAFYLVNEDGQIIVNQTSGEVGSFANKVAVTNPVLYETVLLNNEEKVSSIDVAAIDDDVLPKYYTLYDTSAVYEVTINSNSTGAWKITKGDNVEAYSTYVTDFGARAAYSNELENNRVGDEYTHTTVWFAVVWKPQAHPDAVIVDYGLPVDISVLGNDMFGENGKLEGIGAYSAIPADYDNGLYHDETLDTTQFGTSWTGTYGVATADTATGKVRYTLNVSNGMQMQTYEKFAYAVKYSAETNAGYYYDTITVIPATTIYYEEDFLTYAASNTEWKDEGTVANGVTQDEDRPGKYSLTDANNIYGYDGVYKAMSTYSMGKAKKVHVDADSYATATFTFYGTGFDVISMTSNTTGVLAVKVTAAENIVVNNNVVYEAGAKVKFTVVDTYYGYDYGLYEVTYTYDADTASWIKAIGNEITTEGATEIKNVAPENPAHGDTYTNQEYQWVSQPDEDKAMYQVPVLQANDLPYGKYNVTLTATYMSVMDETTENGYYLYLDAIRIYDPANDGAADNYDADGNATNDTTIENAYKVDGEGWPSYMELRNQLISADTLGNEDTATVIEGLVFIDGDASVGDAQISDYISYGPNNEVYLAPGQRVAFILSDVTKQDTDENGNLLYIAEDGTVTTSVTATPKMVSIVDQIHIGIKSANGESAAWTITNIARVGNTEDNVEAGDWYGAKTSTVDTTTDMYYDITGYKEDIIVISNTGNLYNREGVISITNIKTTYTVAPDAVATASDVDNGVAPASEDYGIAVASADEGVAAVSNVETSGETTVYMTPAAATLTLRALNAMYAPEEPEVFEPEKLEISVGKGKVKEGDRVKVNIKTSDDVEYIVVNGQTVTRYKTDRRTGERIWSVQLQAENAGEMIIEVVAYNGEDVASEAVAESVAVQEKKNPRDILKDVIGRFFR